MAKRSRPAPESDGPGQPEQAEQPGRPAPSPHPEQPQRPGQPQRSERYGVDAEIERLLRCPECGSSKARPVLGSYGVLGLRALGEFGTPREIACRHCGHHWVRPPMRELRREAERRIDARYDEFVAENLRLQEELVRIRKAPRDPDTDGAGGNEAAN